MNLSIIGGGLAGCEAAWQAANRGVQVTLYEMRPGVSTGAHHGDKLAELVCSNSLRADAVVNAVGLLKQEMRLLGSLIMSAADETRVPAGGALAVDREAFARRVTERIEQHPLICVVREEICTLPEGVTIVASGPLTSERLAEHLLTKLGEDYLAFFDAAAPIITRDSVDMDRAFFASRYDKGDADYLNCPMTELEYETFYQALVNAELQEVKDLDKLVVFEGCMPIETMAARGKDTMRFGPLKPVGLVDPRSKQRAHAVVQLRQDNREGSLFNLVGFQTRLKWSEQQRVFRLIPGLASAEFVRFGVMHRNTFINSRRLLTPSLELRSDSSVLFAGQLTGVEGYVESAASGLVAGVNAAFKLSGKSPLVFPVETAHGSLLNYITQDQPGAFQPMNVTFGLFPALENRIKDKQVRNKAYADRAITKLTDFFSKADPCYLFSPETT
ncbi:MAG TPA: methylenetetrahydrofolate--tRNA-(uracil(54)-C(5))-methyltransferase (FADH(2)-oxidizing) TrmFO [Bacillota bacterium]|nr:methylenetetrahydrofolate--tRNA-(uracil(54)-C(5))-methyltransferase (FADH(2)-oxidizing) TrmFO [Bacillota bacterium]